MPDGQQAPWEKYQQTETGPWAKYASPETSFAQSVPPAEPSTWEKLTRGYNPDVEQFAERHPGIVGTGARALDAAGGAVIGMIPSIASSIRHPIDTANSVAQSIEDWTTKPGAILKAAPSVLPEALGQGVGNVAAGEVVGAAMPKISDVVSDARTSVGNRIHTPQGKLTPGARTIGQVGGMSAGGAVGEAIGHPYGGVLVGYKAGPMLIDKLFPESAERVAARENAPPPPRGRGITFNAPMPEMQPAVSQPRMMMDRLDSYLKPEGTIPKITTTPLQDFATRQAAATEAQAASAPARMEAIRGGQSVRTIPEPRQSFEGENPKYMASVPRKNLRSLAAGGKLGAGTQLQQLGEKVIYTPPTGFPGPKEVIRNIGEEAPLRTIPEIERAPARTRKFGQAAD